MSDEKLVNISGTKEIILKGKHNKFQTDSANENIRDMYRGINQLQKRY
jgi:hypothetical protein